ncbi:hypothetical protein Tco_0987661, partial [Tanacetum coccineum]
LKMAFGTFGEFVLSLKKWTKEMALGNFGEFVLSLKMAFGTFGENGFWDFW